MAQLELKIGDKTYNKAWVDNVSSTSQISSDAASVNYGVIPSTGNATMRDINGQIRADIESGVLPVSNAPTKVVINGNQIQEHITSDSNYNIIDKELNLQFSDKLSLLDKVTYEGMPLRDYSMTAYEMLDDVIGSYGGYMRSYPCNWSVFYFSTGNSGEGKVTLGKTTITAHIPYLNGHNGWVGTKISAEPNKKHTLSCSISTSSFSLLSGETGLQVVLATRIPSAGSNPKDYAIASTLLQSNSTNIVNLEFTPTQNSVYFVIMFDNAEKSQTITLGVNTDSVLFDGYSLKMATQNPCDREPTIVANTLAAGSISIQSYLKRISLQYPFLESSSYRETIEKFCTLAQITLALNKDGKIEFYGARPILYDRDGKEIAVPNNYKISNLNKTLFLKNKIDGVDISYNIVKKEKKSNQDVYSTNFSVYDISPKVSSWTQGGLVNATNTGRNISNIEILVPKRLNNNLMRVVAVRGIKIASTGTYKSGTVDSALNETVTETTYGYKWTMPLQEPSDFNEHTSGAKINMADEAIIDVSSIIDKQQVECWKIKIIDAAIDQSYKYYDTSVGSGKLQDYTADSIDVVVVADIEETVFEETNNSSFNIANANNPVSVQTNEVIQSVSLCNTIRDNIIHDYNNGVSTANIDLFCGLKDWENGEIIQPNDILTIEGEDGYWRVTGRTFKYKGAPTLSLELQKQKTKDWHYLTGNISSGTISTGDFTSNGTKKGTIKLPPKDYFAHTTGFTVTVNFNTNGDTSTVKGAGFNSVKVSKYNALGIHTCNCYIDANWLAGTITYTAEEKYDKRLGIGRKSYVESITITTIDQFY